MEDALVSIIVPVYNVEQFLSECIKGIINQTYTNIEIIIIDDGSTDSSGIICDSFLEKDPRIIVKHQNNKGLSGARNTGIDVAKGDYLCFVDSDDMVSPYMVKHLVELVENQHAEISFCSSKRCDSGKKYKDINFDESLLKDIVCYSSEESMRALIKYKKIPVTAWGKLYHRRLFESIRFPEGKYNEDAFISFRIIELSHKTCGCSNSDYYYRVNRNSIMRASFSEKRFDGIEAKLQQLAYISNTYPELIKSAESSIVAVCNECVFDMGVANYSNKDKEALIKKLYDKYCWSYLLDKTSLKGKFFAITSCISLNLGKKIARRLSKYKPTR